MNPASILVTGGSGFLGRQVVAALHGTQWRVLTLQRSSSRALSQVGSWTLEGDISVLGDWQGVVREIAPQVVIHCAGVVKGREAEMFRANVQGFTNVLEAIGPDAHCILVSSGAVYGAGTGLLDERSPLRPNSDYGRSKLAQEELLLKRSGPQTIIRISNLIGPLQSESFFLGRCVRELGRQYRAGVSPKSLVVGDLEAGRDFIDVRDAAQAISRVATFLPVGAYNLSSGVSSRLRDILESLIRLTALDVELSIDSRFGASAVKMQAMDSSALSAAANWTLQITLERSLRDILAAEGIPI